MVPNKFGSPVRRAETESLPSRINTNVMDYLSPRTAALPLGL